MSVTPPKDERMETKPQPRDSVFFCFQTKKKGLRYIRLVQRSYVSAQDYSCDGKVFTDSRVPEFQDLYTDGPHGSYYINTSMMKVIRIATQRGFKVTNGSWNDSMYSSGSRVLHTVILQKYAE